VKEIGVQGIVVPEVVLVVLAFPMAIDHVVQEARHACANVSPEDWAQHVKPRVDGSHDFVVGMMGEALVGRHVGEGLLERNDAMLHQGEGTEPKDGDTGACVRSPLPVKVHLDGLVEDTVTTLDGLSVDTLTVITHLFGLVLDLV